MVAVDGALFAAATAADSAAIAAAAEVDFIVGVAVGVFLTASAAIRAKLEAA